MPRKITWGKQFHGGRSSALSEYSRTNASKVGTDLLESQSRASHAQPGSCRTTELSGSWRSLGQKHRRDPRPAKVEAPSDHKVPVSPGSQGPRARADGQRFLHRSSQEGGKPTASDRKLVVPRQQAPSGSLAPPQTSLGLGTMLEKYLEKLMGASSENKIKRLQALGLWEEGRKGREGRGLAESGLLGWAWREESGLKRPP